MFIDDFISFINSVDDFIRFHQSESFVDDFQSCPAVKYIIRCAVRWCSGVLVFWWSDGLMFGVLSWRVDERTGGVKTSDLALFLLPSTLQFSSYLKI